jgi:hypothetical protein
MSLINDALKKAQRQRTVDAAGVAPPMPGETGTRVTRRNKPLASQSVLLIVAASAVLIVISVVATVYLLREPESSPVTPPIVQSSAPVGSVPAPVDSPSVSPVVFVPLAPLPTSPEVQNPQPEPQPSLVTIPTPPPVITTPPPAPVIVAQSEPAPRVVATASDKPDERILDYIDRLQVLGVRSSGSDSRVLMNDRVYRVNDIVDRGLGLRLIEAQSGRLEFEDARGVRYTKNL